MTPSERLALACELSDGAVSLSASGIRLRNPGISDAEVAIAVRRLLLGVDLAQRMQTLGVTAA
jgi:hypothetical protein